MCCSIAISTSFIKHIYQTTTYYKTLNKYEMNTSLAAKGVLANRLQRRNCLQNPKWPPGGPKMAEGVWKGVYP